MDVMVPYKNCSISMKEYLGIREHLIREYSIKSHKAQEIAKAAYKKGNRVKWDKYNAVSRAWKMAENKIEVEMVPF